VDESEECHAEERNDVGIQPFGFAQAVSLSKVWITTPGDVDS
jgi:hypothetical protein